MLQNFTHKISESGPLLYMFLLACVASLLRTDEYSIKSVFGGIITAGFVAYTVNLCLIDYPLAENTRVVIVGCCAYLNRYLLDSLNKVGANIANNPKQALDNLRSLWKK